MKLLFSFGLFFFCLINILIAQTKDEIDLKSLYNPSDFKIINEEHVVVSDNSINYPVYLVDLKKDQILQKIKRGNGPGELSGMYKNISITDNYIFVWDYGQQVLNYYDHELKYKGSKSFNDIGYIYNIIMDNNNVLILDSSEDFIKIFKYSGNNIVGSKLNSFSISDHENFRQFEQSAIRQAFKINVDKGTFFISNEFTSLVFSVNAKGIKFTTVQPLDVVQENQEGIYIATDLLYNKLCSLDIEASPDHIFVLSKGEKANKSDISEKYNNRINEYLEDFINTNQILLYDIEGNFLKSVYLEKPVKKIEVYKDKIFYLRTLEGTPSIGYYDLSSLSETG